MRKNFHERLDEVTEDILKMGSLVQEAVNNSIEALIEGKTDLAQKVIDDDNKIDEYDILIEEKSMTIQAEHQPVAVDLRLIHSIYLINIYLERIGDIAVSLSKLVIRLYQKDKMHIDSDIMGLLIEMGNLSKSVLSNALKAFKKKDSSLAMRLEQIDDPVDDVQRMIYKKLYSTSSKKIDYLKMVTNISLAVRYMERIGDNAVNVGARVLFFLTGDFRSIHSDVEI
jgi:phosphate transport system protein